MAFDPVAWANSNADILHNIAANLAPIHRLITGGAFLLGLGFAFKAIYALKVYGEARTMMASHASIKEPLVYFFVAAVFMFLPTAFTIFMNTSFGYSSVLAYAPMDSQNKGLMALFGSGSIVGQSLTSIIKVIGLVAFINGWILIARSASQGQPPGGTGKGFMHVFGGILAMNIVGTLQIINNTLYGS